MLRYVAKEVRQAFPYQAVQVDGLVKVVAATLPAAQVRPGSGAHSTPGPKWNVLPSSLPKVNKAGVLYTFSCFHLLHIYPSLSCVAAVQMHEPPRQHSWPLKGMLLDHSLCQHSEPALQAGSA